MPKWSPLLLSVLRIVAGLLFIEHGTQKMFAWPGPADHPPGPAPDHLMQILMQSSGPMELAGGALILIGLFTRPAAFLLSGEMAVAYFTAHSKNGFWPILNHGELAVLYCFLFLYLFAAGGGPLSVDAVLRRKG